MSIIDYSHLTPDERISLAMELWDSLTVDIGNQTFPLTEAQREELESRCAAIDAGEMEMIPWEKAKKSLFSGE